MVESWAGSFVIARIDGKPLYKAHANALVKYLWARLSGKKLNVQAPSTGESFSRWSTDGGISAATWVVSEDDFRKWYEDWVASPRDHHIKSSDSMTGVSPYDV